MKLRVILFIIICLPLNISELHWQYVLKELETGQRFIALVFVNTIQYLRTLKNNIYHSNKWGPPLFLHLHTNPVIGHALVHSFDKTNALDVTVDLIWLLYLNILSFNFVATPRKSLRFTRFIRSYVNRPAVVLTNHCQSYTAFLLDVRCAKLPCSIFCRCLFPMIVHLHCWAHLLLECCELQGGSGDKQMWNSYKYIKFNSWR